MTDKRNRIKDIFFGSIDAVEPPPSTYDTSKIVPPTPPIGGTDIAPSAGGLPAIINNLLTLFVEYTQGSPIPFNKVREQAIVDLLAWREAHTKQEVAATRIREAELHLSFYQTSAPGQYIANATAYLNQLKAGIAGVPMYKCINSHCNALVDAPWGLCVYHTNIKEGTE